MNKKNQLIMDMITFLKGDPKRIQHFLKVYEMAALIGDGEALEERECETLLYAAIVHDIGIHLAEERYHSAAGKYQEELGPELARQMVGKYVRDEEQMERIAYLVGHHHTYNHIEGADYQILVEADFLVNLYEDGVSKEGIQTAGKRIFKTKTGLELLNKMYGLEGEV